MEEALEQLQAKDTKERMAGVERLQTLLEQSRKSLSSSEVSSLVDASMSLLKDNNFRVCQGALQALASAAALAGEHLKLHFNALLPAIVERLGDSKQPVRDAGRRLLLALMEISSPTIIVERAGNYAWGHKNWRVREEFARTAASAINLFAATELPFQRLLLPSVLLLLEDSNNSVREAAMLCLEEMYRQGGQQFRSDLHHHQLRPAQLKEIASRFDKIEPLRHSFDTNQLSLSFQYGVPNHHSATYNHSGSFNQHASANHQHSAPETKVPLSTGNTRRSSPKSKPAGSDISAAGESEGPEKPVEPVRVFSEKELTKEIEKVAGMLTAEQDWSVRMAAMQRVEGLVAGGATEYACFPLLLKQLVAPLSIQLADRRSSIVKQACQLLNSLSKELQADFEVFAESFLPMLFKLVVITVLVIAESADTCIKMILQNCKVARVLPKMIELAKHDRNAVLRARCCEYSVLVLEHWMDTSEIQRSAELFEELIKCCCGDAMGEVRSTARQCYRVFARCWPDRARRLFQTLDPVIQRLVNEEDGGFHKRYASPAVRERGSYQQQQLRQPTAMPATQPTIVRGSSMSSYGANDRSLNMVSGAGSGLLQKKSVEAAPERSLESVLQASQQQVNAIETMLRGVDIDDKGAFAAAAQTGGRDPAGGSYRKIHAAAASGPMRLGVDPPSARDPPHPASAPASNQGSMRAMMLAGTTSGYYSGSASTTLAALQALGSSDVGKVGTSRAMSRDAGVGAPSGMNRDFAGVLGKSQTAKRIPMNTPRSNHGSLNGDYDEGRAAKRIPKPETQMDRLVADATFNAVPAYQRPLLRQTASGRSLGGSRISMEDNQMMACVNPFGEVFNYMDGLMSLNDALTEGLSPSADWSARVAAFTYLRKLLQQGTKGLQEVGQSFDRVMKLFSEHLDDPHHKVAQAALSTLAELVPVCRKTFESYLERILPRVFARLVDAKEVIRHLSTSTLEIVGNTYSIDSLLPALLRSLDEQRSPKAKMAVIEFAIAAFAKLALNGEASGGSGLLKLWLAKLAPLANDKNPKLKETAVTGLISVYSHFDSTTVLNFILGLSIEEQSTLRRALKHYTPRIEVDLMTYLQNRSQRSRVKPGYEQADFPLALSEGKGAELPGRPSALPDSPQGLAGYSGMSLSNDGGVRKKSASVQPESTYPGHQEYQQLRVDDTSKHLYQSLEPASKTGESFTYSRTRDTSNGVDFSTDRSAPWLTQSQGPHALIIDERHDNSNSGVLPLSDAEGMVNLEQRVANSDSRLSSESLEETKGKYDDKLLHQKVNLTTHNSGSSVPNLLHQMSNWGNGKPAEEKQEALQHLVQLSRTNDSSTWSQYFNQILTLVLESLDDPEPAVRELALSVILEMLSNQRTRLDEATELLLEKLLNSARDSDSKVSKAADVCLNAVLTQLDTYRCLSVVVPLLVSEDEKALVICIGCLTKLVSRLPSEELVAQLRSFLPVLFDAFGNQNADVRKTVVFCLVEIYIVLGKAFVPYLGSLSGTQLRLVTIYANRISQARTGTTLETPQLQ